MARIIDVTPYPSRFRRVALVVFASLIGCEVAILVLGFRVLVSETRVEPGQTYIVEGWGNVGAAQAPSLVCRYFTGRSVRPHVLWYSANNIMGADQCPFIAWPSAISP